MNDVLDANRQLWDSWTELHENSPFYDIPGFVSGKTSLQKVELEELGDEVEGRELLHLQCHFGLDTLSWGRLGARVTGMDLSPKAMERARRLSRETNIPARFVESDLYALPEVLDEGGTFDIVYTSYGAIDWLRDLDRWARIIAWFLKPGGIFYMVEFHPFALTLGEDGRSIEDPYFPRAEPIQYEEKGSYAVAAEEVTGHSHVWPHSLSEIVNAVLGSGLRLEYLHEFPESPYDCFPFTQEIEPGRAIIPGLEGKMPLLFSLRATKPTEG